MAAGSCPKYNVRVKYLVFILALPVSQLKYAPMVETKAMRASGEDFMGGVAAAISGGKTVTGPRTVPKDAV